MDNEIVKIEVVLESQKNVKGIIRIDSIRVYWNDAKEPTVDNKLPYLYHYHKIDEIYEEIAKKYHVCLDKIKVAEHYIY